MKIARDYGAECQTAVETAMRQLEEVRHHLYRLWQQGSFRVPLDVNQILNLPVLATVPDVHKALAEKQKDRVDAKVISSDTAGTDKKQGELRDPQPAS